MTKISPVPHFDLAIVGSGSGNSVLTPALAGLRTAIIESGTFGGTCINVGCVPTKMYVYAADLANDVRGAARYGIDATVDAVRWTDIRDRIFARIDAIAAGGREYRAHGVATTLFEAHARFVGDRELLLSTGDTVSADRIVIASGSRAAVPPLVAASGVAFHTSDTVMRIDALPPRLAILGGGYIGAEFAHVFSALGSAVTLIVRDRMLRHLDRDLGRHFTVAARRQWDVRLGTDLRNLTSAGDGVRLELTDGRTLDADLLLVATGRVSNGDLLDAPLGGVELHPDGRIVVDQYLRTTADGVWALGDVSSPYQLKHVANHEARVVAHNLACPDDLVAVDHRFVPAAVFSHPQLAAVGRTEDELAAAGVAHVSYLQELATTAFGWASEDTTSFCKLIADPDTGQLLGAHLLCPNAATVIQPLVQAMSTGQGVGGLARGQYWIHPAQSELVENALLGVEELCRRPPAHGVDRNTPVTG